MSTPFSSSRPAMKMRRFLTALAAGLAILAVGFPAGHSGSPVLAADAALAGHATPSALTFSSGTADAQTFTVTTTAAGPLTAVTSDSKVATVSAIPNAPGITSSHLFSVSPAGPGTATITVADSTGAKLLVSIDVMGGDSGKLNGSSLPIIAGVGVVVAIVALLGIHRDGNQVTAATPTAPPSATTPTPTPAPTSPVPATPTPTPAAVVSGSPTATPTPTPLPSGVTASPTLTPTPTSAPTGAATATATPTPTPAPTLTAGPLTVTPAELDFVVGSGTTTGTFTAMETGYVGIFTVAVGNTAVATVSPGSGSGPSQTFTVTEQAVGSTVITVSDTNGNSAQVTVYVTQTNATVNGRARHATAPVASPRRPSR